MRKILNTKRFNDLLNLVYLKSNCSDSSITIEYPIGTKLPTSFAVSDKFFIYKVKLLNSRILEIWLVANIHFLTNYPIERLKYNLSTPQYNKFKTFVE